ncbi:MAG: tetratricopeptide repeat protein, partial [Candidatus Marinimicrobia bacterium]|nr:tetratricopeptide repeat protein [Candidatus Neomarinimicrobiota bacterium]
MKKYMLKMYSLSLIIISFWIIQCGTALKKSSKSENQESAVQREYNALAINHFMEGSLLDMQENYTAAIEEYKKALRFDSTSATIHLSLSEDYTRLSKYAEAIKSAKKAIEL